MILGTAQIGLNYGISNRIGQPSKDQAKLLFETAKTHGITILDTANAYGDSEKIIGELDVYGFRVISKLPNLAKIQYSDKSQITKVYLQQTLLNIKQKQLHAYLLHSIDNLDFNGENLWQEMLNLKNQGLTNMIGYSLYSPKQLDLYFHRFKPDIVQIPMNIIDREFQKSGWLKKLKDNGVQIHARSIFLQGLLLMGCESQILKFPKYIDIWSRLQNEIKLTGLSALEYCLAFVNQIEELDEIIVGVNSASELQEIVGCFSSKISAPIELTSSDENLIYPFNW